MKRVICVFRQVSYGSTSPTLLKRDTYPLFFRTIPSDVACNKARIALLKKFNWNQVGLIGKTDIIHSEVWSNEYVTKLFLPYPGSSLRFTSSFLSSQTTAREPRSSSVSTWFLFSGYFAVCRHPASRKWANVCRWPEHRLIISRICSLCQ